MRPKKAFNTYIYIYIYIYLYDCIKKKEKKKGSPREAKKPPNLPLPIRKDWKEKNKEPKEKLVCHYP